MPERIEAPLKIAAEVNSQAAIKARARAGRIPWTGPLVVMLARPSLIIVGQALAAVVLKAEHHSEPWHEAGYWWTVYCTLADVGCLAAMLWFTRREGIRLCDLIGPIRLRFGRDILLGFGYLVLVFPLFLVGGALSRKLLYGSSNDPGAYLFQPHVMPLWGIIYSLSFFWIIWSATEEATYQAYALPRIRALSGRTWFAFALVGFVWSFQHCLLPLLFDFRFILYRTTAFVPGVFAMMVIYWRTRRLAPLIVAHWPMDIAGALMTCVLPNLK